MTKVKLAIGVILVAIVIAIVYLLGHKAAVGTYGAISPTDGSATNFTEITASVGAQLATLFLGGTTAATSIGEQVSTGSCASATTTTFAVLNPFTATSTATLQQFYGVGNATTTLFNIGTSTVSSIPTTGLTGSLVINASVATGTQFFLSSGIRYGGLALDAGSASLRTIIVGPSEYVAGYATTTISGMGTNYSGTYTSCVYKIRWVN